VSAGLSLLVLALALVLAPVLALAMVLPLALVLALAMVLAQVLVLALALVLARVLAFVLALALMQLLSELTLQDEGISSWTQRFVEPLDYLGKKFCIFKYGLTAGSK
jgi:hypothetical protein